MTAKEKLEYAGFDDVAILENYSYDTALVGVTEDNRAVYDFELMVEWIEYNTIRALPYFGDGAPIIMYPLAVV